MTQPDCIIAGAGIVGLSLALELNRRGTSVTVLEAGRSMRQTSAAAAGTLAVEDRFNPDALHPLSLLSAALYPAYLDRIGELSGTLVPFQTRATLEECEPGSTAAVPNPASIVPYFSEHTPPLRLLDELSVDPRQLGDALHAAVLATRIVILENTGVHRVHSLQHSVRVESTAGAIEAGTFIDCMGSWSPAPVAPRKGQMLAVMAPAGFDLRTAIRTHAVYVIPRTRGPNAGHLIIGSTMEDAGFDLTVHPQDILTLNARAVRMLPALAEATFLESWSGLRPYTADTLPILGRSPAQPRYVVATGHFRNGILLAPATAQVIAQLIFNEQPGVDLAPYSPARFHPQ